MFPLTTHALILMDDRAMFEPLEGGGVDLTARDLSGSPFNELAELAGACATFMLEAYNDERAQLEARVLDVAAERFPHMSWRSGAPCAPTEQSRWETRMAAIVPQAGRISSAQVQRAAQSPEPASQGRVADAWRKEVARKLKAKDDGAAFDILYYITCLRQGLMPGFRVLDAFPFPVRNASYDIRSCFVWHQKGRLYGQGHLVLVECVLRLTKMHGEVLPPPFVAVYA